MIDVVRAAEDWNSLPLSSLLEGSDTRFHVAVLGALIRDGFELGEALPCLQHPADILKSLRWLETSGFGKAWATLQQALLDAGRLGVLVDLGAGRSNHHPHVTPFRYEPSAGYLPRHSETA